MSHLFSPLALGPLTLANRIVIAPMCQYSAEHGCAGDWHAQHLGTLAQSGAGLLILEATAVEARGRISWADLGLYDAASEAALSRVLNSVRRWSPIALGVQLAHAGRKASVQRPWEGGAAIAPDQPLGWTTVAPSPLPTHADAPTPQALDLDGIEAIIAAFVEAARRAERLHLQLIELHAAHGYLLHQFLSPLSNQRQDDYGGSLQNRMRLPLRIFDAVRAAVSERIALGMRISASDWIDGGWDLAQSLALAKALEARGAHFIHVSSGGLERRQQIPIGPGYQVPFAAAIKAEISTPVIAVGLINEAQQAEAILAEGRADAVALARGLLYDPRWPWHAAAALGDRVHAAPQYLRCQPHGLADLFDH